MVIAWLSFSALTKPRIGLPELIVATLTDQQALWFFARSGIEYPS
jgi:hypothetical protein